MKAIIFLLIFSVLLLASCGDDDSGPPPLPQGCASQGVFAISVLAADLKCTPTNAFRNTEEALGAPDAAKTGSGKNEFAGMLSLGVDGGVTLYMGSCIQDQAGPDLRVYQVVSEESVEVQVAQSENGPFVSLGSKSCGETSPFFAAKCDFDLAGSGLNAVRIVRVIDRERLNFPDAACDNAGPSPGADIDSVEVLHP